MCRHSSFVKHFPLLVQHIQVKRVERRRPRLRLWPVYCGRGICNPMLDSRLPQIGPQPSRSCWCLAGVLSLLVSGCPSQEEIEPAENCESFFTPEDLSIDPGSLHSQDGSAVLPISFTLGSQAAEGSGCISVHADAYDVDNFNTTNKLATARGWLKVDKSGSNYEAGPLHLVFEQTAAELDGRDIILSVNLLGSAINFQLTPDVTLEATDSEPPASADDCSSELDSRKLELFDESGVYEEGRAEELVFGLQGSVMLAPRLRVSAEDNDPDEVCAAVLLFNELELPEGAYHDGTNSGMFALEPADGFLRTGAIFNPFDVSEEELSGKDITFDATVVTDTWRAETRVSVPIK